MESRVQTLNSQIEVVDGAIPDSLCDKIISEFESSYSLRSPGKTGSNRILSIKKSTDLGVSQGVEYEPEIWEPIDNELFQCFKTQLDNYRNKYPYLDAKGRSQIVDTGYLIMKYDKGYGGYGYHTDVENKSSSSRILVMTAYLNDIDEGGETEFAYQEAKVKPVKGRMVLFPPFWNYPHTGLTPISHDKYVLTTFVVYKG